MKPRLLFISPFVPAPTGNGPAMRAASSICALDAYFDVHLLVVGSAPCRHRGVEMQSMALRDSAFVPLRLWPDPQANAKHFLAAIPPLYRRCFPRPFEWQAMTQARFEYPFSETEFDVAHVFRLYAVPVLESIRARATVRETWLDLDDIESATRLQLAALHRTRGEHLSAAHLAAEAEQYSSLEAARVRSFDRVFVCSADDRDHLQKHKIHDAPEIAPNIVSIPDRLPLKERRNNPFQFLFVGSLGYLPNRDGLEWLVSEVLPRLRKAAPRPFVIRVVGAGLPRRVAEAITSQPELELSGYVQDLDAVYRGADAVIVPLRAGGGTRIKLLEAFAHGCPVISTTEGARGIEAEPDRHLLITDPPFSFAEQCARLMGDEDLSTRLTQAAHELVRSRYGMASLVDALAPRPA